MSQYPVRPARFPFSRTALVLGMTLMSPPICLAEETPATLTRLLSSVRTQNADACQEMRTPLPQNFTGVCGVPPNPPETAAQRDLNEHGLPHLGQALLERSPETLGRQLLCSGVSPQTISEVATLINVCAPSQATQFIRTLGAWRALRARAIHDHVPDPCEHPNEAPQRAIDMVARNARSWISNGTLTTLRQNLNGMTGVQGSAVATELQKIRQFEADLNRFDGWINQMSATGTDPAQLAVEALAQYRLLQTRAREVVSGYDSIQRRDSQVLSVLTVAAEGLDYARIFYDVAATTFLQTQIPALATGYWAITGFAEGYVDNGGLDARTEDEREEAVSAGATHALVSLAGATIGGAAVQYVGGAAVSGVARVAPRLAAAAAQTLTQFSSQSLAWIGNRAGASASRAVAYVAGNIVHNRTGARVTGHLETALTHSGGHGALSCVAEHSRAVHHVIESLVSAGSSTQTR